MPKKTLILLVFFVLLMTACQGAMPTSPAASETSASQPSLPATQAQVETPAGTSPTSTSGVHSLPASGETIQCTVVSQMPTPGPTEQSIFPPVSGSDWVMGPDTAAVTFIEYGDFQ
jgi:hypothetical protein